MSALSSFRLDGKHVLVTGVGGGIGRALVTAFRDAGATVWGADRNEAAVEGLGLAEMLFADFADVHATQKATDDFIGRVGVPDIVISNAGYTRAETLDDLDIDVWQSELTINLNAAFALTAPLVDRMAERGSGSLVFISSVNGLTHYGNPAYSAAKAGLIAYAKAIAVERGPRGVRANVICPGSVRTPAWDHRLAADPTLLKKVLPHYPLGRLVSPEQVAQTTVFLASPASGGITGAVIPVDAGLTAGNLRFVDDVLRG